jgi:hypothetical protein
LTSNTDRVPFWESRMISTPNTAHSGNALWALSARVMISVSLQTDRMRVPKRVPKCAEIRGRRAGGCRPVPGRYRCLGRIRVK